MIGSFYAPKLKIERARKHFAELDSEIAAFLANRPARFESQILPPEDGTQRIAFQMHLHQPPPLLGAIIGDVIHNLRAALDLTACETVRAKEGAEANVDNVYFPFCREASYLNRRIKDCEFNRAGDEAVALLRTLEPYPKGNATLWAIHQLDIQDKHKALIPTFLNVSGPILSRWDDDGTPNLTFVGDPTAPSVLKLVFPAGSFEGREILQTLKDSVEITVSVVEGFRALSEAG